MIKSERNLPSGLQTDLGARRSARHLHHLPWLVISQLTDLLFGELQSIRQPYNRNKTCCGIIVVEVSPLDHPLTPKLFIVPDFVYVLDRVHKDEIKSFPKTGRVRNEIRVGGDSVGLADHPLTALFAKEKIKEEHGGVRVRVTPTLTSLKPQC